MLDGGYSVDKRPLGHGKLKLTLAPTNVGSLLDRSPPQAGFFWDILCIVEEKCKGNIGFERF